jgi:hypothetical protein
VVVTSRGIWRGLVAALLLLGVAAVLGAGVAAVNALDSHVSLDAIRQQLADRGVENEDLRLQLNCRYVLSADRDRLESEIFVTTALALAAAGRGHREAVRLYTEKLEVLASQLDEANERRQDAIRICETEPENVLG